MIITQAVPSKIEKRCHTEVTLIEELIQTASFLCFSFLNLIVYQRKLGRTIN